jgi:hypothetical protein
MHDLSLAQLLVPGVDPASIHALEVLANEVSAHTSLRVQPEVQILQLDDPALFLQPIAFLAGSGSFPAWTEADRSSLVGWLTSGGILVIDDRSGTENSGFADSVRRETEAMFPGREFQPLSPEHAVHRSFFLTGSGAGRRPIRPYMLGIELGDTTPLLMSRNDLLGALEPGPVRWGEAYGWRGDAVALAINLVMYAVTANYKRDAVHVETLMLRLRREGGRWP